MPNKFDSFDVVHEGWLTKSPPSKRIWRARWRKRWFVLRYSGERPAQYYLDYYTDRNYRTLKGQIVLDQCDQLDAGLEFESNKHKYRHIFDVITTKRTYYLAAETEADMNRWVNCICQVCGFKPYPESEDVYPYGADDDSGLVGVGSGHSDSQPVSPSSTASGPYIAISECITGAPLHDHHHHCPPSCEGIHDSPRRLQPLGHLEPRGSGSTTPSLQSPGTETESVSTDEELKDYRPPVNWETFPNRFEGPLEESRPSFISTTTRNYTKPYAPPLPSKSQHLINGQESPLEESSSLCQKVEKAVKVVYDFPRSHKLNQELDSAPRIKHCCTNVMPNQTCENVSWYESTDKHSGHVSNTPQYRVHYCNLSSPILSGNPPPPHRELKPGRKTSDSVSSEPSSQQPFVVLNHLRNLKLVPLSEQRDESPLTPSPIRKAEVFSPNTDFHGGQSPNIGNLKNSRYSSTSPPSRTSPKKEIQYLDLDFSHYKKRIPSNIEKSVTLYKEIDFIKTEALIKTRLQLEEERKHYPKGLH